MRALGRRILTAGLSAVAALAVIALPASARPGDVLVTSDSGNSVVRVDSSGAVTPVAAGAPLDAPIGLDFSPAGSLLVGDVNLPGIIRVLPGPPSLFGGSPPIQEPWDVEFGPGGLLYATEFRAGLAGVYSVDPVTGAATRLAGAGDFGNATQMAVRHGDGEILVADDGGEVIGVNPVTGAQTLVFDGAPPTTLYGIALSPAGEIFFADPISDEIRRVTGPTSSTLVTGGNLLAQPLQIEFDLRGDLVVADGNNGLLRVDLPAAQQQLIAPESPAMPSVEGLTIEPPRCGGKLATITGTGGRDVLQGSPFRDVVVALGGKDTVRGLGGPDLICGGAGKDRLLGGAGKDRLIGGKGRDVCRGGKGRDSEKGC